VVGGRSSRAGMAVQEKERERGERWWEGNVGCGLVEREGDDGCGDM
jgi:hypothetical protein